ncbi:dixin-A isoform X2 [Electrophorus electricus]|uniref:dixin-A isoform X2 n=1 Tax=Electrophorus electricus TaxID=8005 RepID=UPI0015D088AD|nr:dixin-A isoform X2 [Electrophorus electricus]
MGAKPMKCLSSSSPAHTPKEEYLSTPSKEPGRTEGNHTVQPQSLREDAAKINEPSPGPEPAGMGDGTSWEEQLCAQQEQLEKEMQETRKMVSRLQALLLHGSLPEDEQTASFFGEAAAGAEQQLILIRSRLDQSMEESLDLKRELLRFKQEARNLQAVKDSLQQRMLAQEDTVLQLKQELMRSTMDKEDLTGQNVDLQRKLSDRDRLLSECKKELAQKDRLLQQQQAKLDESLRRLSESHGVSGCENNGYTHTMDMSSSPFLQHGVGDELQLVRDALRSLRNSFSGHDPQHHTLDTLEQGMANLIDRLHTSDSKKRQGRKNSHHVSPQHSTKSPGQRANHTERESWPPSSKMAHSHSSPVLASSAVTKVLYFTDRSLTPFLVNIPKRLGEITLQDFKVAVDRHGNFRYHFKSLDPEFGTVKEEVFQNDAVVPGWEGKIVAWVEEDHGEGR